MRVCGAWIRIHYVLCSKRYSTFGGLFWTPVGSRRATRGACICETRLLDKTVSHVATVVNNEVVGLWRHIWEWRCFHIGVSSLHWRHNDHDSVPNHDLGRLFTQSFIQTQIKENIKAPRHWPLCGEFSRTGEFPAQRASYAENVSTWWRHVLIFKKAKYVWSKKPTPMFII